MLQLFKSFHVILCSNNISFLMISLAKSTGSKNSLLNALKIDILQTAVA